MGRRNRISIRTDRSVHKYYITRIMCDYSGGVLFHCGRAAELTANAENRILFHIFYFFLFLPEFINIKLPKY